MIDEGGEEYSHMVLERNKIELSKWLGHNNNSIPQLVVEYYHLPIIMPLVCQATMGSINTPANIVQ